MKFIKCYLFFSLFIVHIINAQTIAPSITDFSIQLVYPSLFHQPMSFAFHPSDGRTLIILKNGQILITTCCFSNKTEMKVFLDISKTSRLSTVGDGGLFSLTFDPFDDTTYIYIQYLQRSATLLAGVEDRIVISRFTIDPINPYSALPFTEKILFQHSILQKGQINHFGGGLVFGSDGLLYSTSGVASISPYTKAQDLSSSLGKVIRIDKNGILPTQNPFYSSSGTVNTNSIFATGFRNPFTLSRSLESNDMYISDVGETKFEEVNILGKGANFGWPLIEGYLNLSSSSLSASLYTDPILSYPHEGTGQTVRGCCITGSVEYKVSNSFDKTSSPFPTFYQGKVFFIEFCGGWINYISSPKTSTRFASGFKNPTGLAVNPYDGGLYIATEMGDIYKITNTALKPPLVITIVAQPKNHIVFEGDITLFIVKVSSTTSQMSFRWQSMRVGSRTWIFTNVFSDTYSFTATLIDSGTIYRAIISIPESNTTLVSSIASLTVKPASIFHAIIDQTSIGNGSLTYYGGQKFNIKGSLYQITSFESLIIPAIHTWSLTLNHGFHSHALSTSVIGTPTSPLLFSFIAPVTGEFDFNQSLTITFTANMGDDTLFTTTTTLVPISGYLKLKTFPSGLKINVNGATVDAPYEIRTVAGMIVEIGPPSGRICLGWTDGGFGINGTRMYNIPLATANRIITIKLL
jgi:hypothetical protein